MKISVITIVYNDKNNIERTINSVINQTAINNLEYIVIDGMSNDGTSDIIKSFADKIDLYINEKDTGIYNAMNKGIKYASGDYIIFMNSGDTFSNHTVLENVISSINVRSNYPSLVYGDYRNVINGVKTKIIPSRKPELIWYGFITAHQSVFYNLRFLRENNIRYDENYKIAADYKMTLEVLKKSNYKALRLPLCISDFDMSGISNHNQNLGLEEANKVRRELLKWGFLKEKSLTLILLLTRFIRTHFSVLHSYLRRL